MSEFEINQALAAGAALGDPKTLESGHYTIVPVDYTLRDLENLLDRPRRKRGCPIFTAEKGFTDYVRDHAVAGTRIYADAGAQTMTAVIDHHETGAVGWGQHRAQFQPPKDPDWSAWMDKNDKVMSQVAFAQFVEDMLPTIIEPDGADILEVAQDLEAKRNVAFKSAERLADGRRAFHYSEEVTGKVGSARVEVPETFTIKCPVFQRGDPVTLEAKLRYRIDDGALKLWYHLHRPNDALDDAFQRLLDGVATVTGITPWMGSPAGLGGALGG